MPIRPYGVAGQCVEPVRMPLTTELAAAARQDRLPEVHPLGRHPMSLNIVNTTP